MHVVFSLYNTATSDTSDTSDTDVPGGDLGAGGVPADICRHHSRPQLGWQGRLPLSRQSGMNEHRHVHTHLHAHPHPYLKVAYTRLSAQDVTNSLFSLRTRTRLSTQDVGNACFL